MDIKAVPGGGHAAFTWGAPVRAKGEHVLYQKRVVIGAHREGRNCIRQGRRGAKATLAASVDGGCLDPVEDISGAAPVETAEEGHPKAAGSLRFNGRVSRASAAGPGTERRHDAEEEVLPGLQRPGD